MSLCGKLFACNPESEFRFCCKNCGGGTRIVVKVPCGPITVEYSNIANWDPSCCSGCDSLNDIWELAPIGGFAPNDWCEWEGLNFESGLGNGDLCGCSNIFPGAEFKIECCLNDSNEIVLYVMLTTFLSPSPILYKELERFPNDGECHNFDLVAELPMTMNSFSLPAGMPSGFCNPEYDPGENTIACDLTTLAAIINL